MKRAKRLGGFSLLEAILVVIVIGVMLAVSLPFLQPRHHGGGRQMKDATQVRGIEQAMEIWANQNSGLFPLPSKIDGEDATVRERGSAKDTTANILSVLIYTGGISVELCINPADSNTAHIMQDDDYAFDGPSGAVDPVKALWDPKFSSDFSGDHVSNNSYAHEMPGGSRRGKWQDTFAMNWPVVGDRGPQISSITDPDGARPVAKLADPDSFTLLIHGARNTWEGNIAYADGHVNFETRLFVDGVTRSNGKGKRVLDCLFYDETESPANALLGVYTTAGDEDQDFTLIWD